MGRGSIIDDEQDNPGHLPNINALLSCKIPSGTSLDMLDAGIEFIKGPGKDFTTLKRTSDENTGAHVSPKEGCAEMDIDRPADKDRSKSLERSWSSLHHGSWTRPSTRSIRRVGMTHTSK